ncbi:putative AlkP superfamily pyrophosphatase or phosphodiesterase [Friedmanniella endophytica]|uniref:Putative AlkP superfamily pyrophosphatase or phosphodiesterase n=1 Tax=Microlunatus kandeliicorticis TaxID=1759536 RepID=A0A7W3IU71_9ACTN|nr:nucleotide pyrophosphatase/phosphodiesterase family protein [Microlunatus kandeliicorticis]MBA8795347.1 putative AlkP superfamily pyrophosphatase or phosphodiesterase [Microlunatus kandeliicorticis]
MPDTPAPAVDDLTRPAYGRRSLSDLLPSIGAHLGVPGCPRDLVGVRRADGYVVVLVDGLGWTLLRQSLAGAPYLAGLAEQTEPLTATAPSTTATSLASLGTGLPPGRHGIVGYSTRVPDSGAVLNALTWDADVDPRRYQPHPTLFERAAAAGIRTTSVGLERFAASGLTAAALRGPGFVGLTEEARTERRVAAVVEAATGPGRGLVYVYERRLDHAGHAHGWRSGAWRDRLARVDDLCRQLRDALPAEIALVVTGDHGMVDVPVGHRLVVEDEPELGAGVDTLAGEGRFRQLYVDRDDPAAVAARWADRLDERAWVRSRDEAVEDGWFGPVDAEVRERYGDVLVAMRSDWAVMTRAYPRELDLVGMHGSLTPAEMTVPLLVD